MIPFSNIFAGNSIFTAVSKKTGDRFTYRVIRSKNKIELYYVKVLTGSIFSYIGCYYPNKGFLWSIKSNISPEQKSVIVIKYILSKERNPLLGGIGSAFIELYHEGKCCKCGKRLTTPESIKSELSLSAQNETRIKKVATCIYINIIVSLSIYLI